MKRPETPLTQGFDGSETTMSYCARVLAKWARASSITMWLRGSSKTLATLGRNSCAASTISGSISIVSSRSMAGASSRTALEVPVPRPITAAVRAAGWCAGPSAPSSTMVWSSGVSVPPPGVVAPSALPLVSRLRVPSSR